MKELLDDVAVELLADDLTHQPVIIFHQLLVGLQFQIAIFFVCHKFQEI